MKVSFLSPSFLLAMMPSTAQNGKLKCFRFNGITKTLEERGLGS